MAQSLANVLALLRKMFAWERLPEPPPQEPPRGAGPGVLRLLLGAEPLPTDPVGEEPRHGPGFLAAIFQREELPLDPVPQAGPEHRSVISLVLGREALPEDPPGPPRRRARWAAWLFAPERIDRERVDPS